MSFSLIPLTAPQQKSKLVQWFRSYCCLDTRSLALFRIALGVLLLMDLISRARFLRAHYTDFGVLPRGPLVTEFAYSDWLFSLHLVNGNVFFQGFLFAAASCFAISLLFGFYTRLSTVISWIFLLSLHTRNPMVLQGGDDFLRVLLFWAMFLPLGARFSIDDLQSSEKPLKHHAPALPSIALVAQIASVYLFTMLFKRDPVWYESFTAVEQALRIDHFTKPLGYFLLQYPELLRVVTMATVFLEWFAVIALLTPIFTKYVRLVASILLIGFHLLGLQLTMELGLFPWICATAWIAVLPSLFWEMRGVAYVLKKLSGLWKRVLPRGVVSYSSSVMRYSCHKSRFLVVKMAKNGFILFTLVYVSLWNVRELYPEVMRRYFPYSLNWYARTLRIDQRWDMFSPYPMTEDGWYVIEGKLRNNQSVNVWDPELPVSYEKPALVAKMYPTQRWRKYMMNLWLTMNQKHRLYYGRYLCRNWNTSRSEGEHLMTFEIHYMREDTLPDGSEKAPERVTIWSHYCFDLPAEDETSPVDDGQRTM